MPNLGAGANWETQPNELTGWQFWSHKVKQNWQVQNHKGKLQSKSICMLSNDSLVASVEAAKTPNSS